MPVRNLLRLALLLAGLFAAQAARAQGEDELAFARAFLDRLQIRSIVENREFCGYFGRDEAGRLRATKPRRGKSASCQTGTPPPAWQVFANYHTHAGFDRDSYDEVPSPQDLRGDIDSTTDGYVSTPGGRLWFSDYRAAEVRQVCGAGCLAQDPAFRPGKLMKVARRYSLADLEWLMER